MSYRTAILRALALSSLVAAASATAQELDKRLYVAPMLSYSLADAERGTDDGLGAAVSIGRKMATGLNLELTGFFTQLDGDGGAAVNGSNSAEFTGFGIAALIFPLQEFPEVFGVIGLHQGHTSGHPGPVQNFKSTVFDTGVGYLLPVSWLGLDFDLRADARYRMDAHTRAQAGKGGDKHFYDGVINLGAVFPLGPAPAAAVPDADEEPLEVVTPAAPDSDNDGIPDDTDQCPGTIAGAIVDEKGCEKDEDGDGVVDRLDRCPGTPAGTPVTADGCPVVVPEPEPAPVDTGCRQPAPGEPITLDGCAAGDAIVLRGVNFDFKSARLSANAKVILDQVADALVAASTIKVEIGGHTDSKGSDAINDKLSLKRANAVRDYLVARGIPADRLTAKGYGKGSPIDTNETEEGRELNRRVELKIVQ